MQGSCLLLGRASGTAGKEPILLVTASERSCGGAAFVDRLEVPSGMALSAVLTSKGVADPAKANEYFFFTTHVNDPAPAAVGLKVLEIVIRDRLVERARVAGERLEAGLLRLKQRYPAIGDVRGRGLLRGLEFVDFGK